MHRIPLSAASSGGVAVGLILMFGPRAVLDVVTSQDSEVEILRYLGFVAMLLGLQWGWVQRQSGRAPHPARRRAAGAWSLLAIYVFTSSGLFLILGFSLLMAAALEVGLERALAYSEALHRRLDPGGRPPQ